MTQYPPPRFDAVILVAACMLASCSPPPSYDVLVKGGTIYDGSLARVVRGPGWKDRGAAE